MNHLDRFLFNNRPLIKIFIDKMSGSTDDFYTPVKSLPVWSGTFECWQKRRMDIDQLIGIPVYKLRTEDSHIFGQIDIIKRMLIDDLSYFFLMFAAGRVFITDVIIPDIKFMSDLFINILIGKHE